MLAAKTWSMYSPTFAQEVGDEGLKSQASGTGPFMVETFVPNEDLVLTKNPNYWQEGLPYLDSVVFRAVPDINARAIQLEAGDVNMALDLAIQDVERLRTNTDIRVEEGAGSRQYYVTMNNAKAPLDDVRVRQALNYAVDKEGIIQAVFLGRYATLRRGGLPEPRGRGLRRRRQLCLRSGAGRRAARKKRAGLTPTATASARRTASRST